MSDAPQPGAPQPGADATSADAASADAASVPLGWRIGIIVLFAALYGWFLFAAVSNLVALPSLYASQGYAEYIPWAPLILGVVLPPVLYATALLIGRGRMLSPRVVAFAAGLAATAATSLTLYVLG
ncbi:MAG: hypothetical protein QM675_08260 [Protaetiibacter sp.]